MQSAVAKWVFLKFDAGQFGQLQSVTLRICMAGGSVLREVTARLEPDAVLEKCLQDWCSCCPGSQPLMGSASSRGTAWERSGRALSDRFNQWLRQPSLAPLREAWLETLRPEDELWVVLQTPDREIQQLPWYQWELMERYPKAEIALGQPNDALWEAVLRAPKPTSSSSAPLKVLIVFSDRHSINDSSDPDKLKQKFPNAEITLLVEPQVGELEAQLSQQSWQVLFWADAGLEAEDSSRADAITSTLQQAGVRGLQLAVINAPNGLAIAQACTAIPQLIVLQAPASDAIAWAFFKYWLSAYESGTAFYLAVRQARERLQALERKFPLATWLPMIVQNSAAVLPRRSPAPTRSAPHLKTFVTASLIATALVSGVQALGWLRPLELKTYDALLQLRPDEPPDSRLLIVEMPDQATSADAAALSELIELLERQGAIAIGLIPDKSLSGDPKLEQQIAASDRRLIACQPQTASAEINTASASDLRLDADQVLRRHWLTVPASANCKSPYSFSVQLAQRYLAQQDIELEPLGNGYWQLGQARLRPVTTYPGQLNPGEQLLLNYRAYRSISAIAPRISLSDALAANLSAEQVSDRIVLIGPTAEGAQTATTPYGLALPEVIVQAQVVSQLLSAALNQRVLLWRPSKLGQGLWIAIGAMVGAAISHILRRHRWRFLMGGLGLAILFHGGLGFFALVNAGAWLPLVAGGAAIAIAGLGRKFLAVIDR